MDYTLARNPDTLTLPDIASINVRLVYTGVYSADALSASAEQLVAYYAAALILDNLASNTADVVVRNVYTGLAQQYRAQYTQATTVQCGQYATPQQLLNRFGATELAQLCKIPQADLFTQQILGQQSSPTLYKLEDIARAKAAVKMLCQACIDADAYITIYLSRYTAPIPRPLIDVATNAACDLARWQLWDKGELTVDNVVRRRYEAAMTLLEDVRDGLVRTGGEQGNYVEIMNTPRRGW